MAYLEDTIRITIHAAINGEEEEANFGFYLFANINDVLSRPTNQELADEAAADVAAAFAAASNAQFEGCFSNEVVFQSVRAVYLNPDGTADSIGLAPIEDADGIPGAGGSTSLPFECATVVSLYGYEPGTFTQNRARKRGRFYLPPLSVGAMGANGRLSDTYHDYLADWAEAFLNDVNGKEIDGSVANRFVLVVASDTGSMVTQVSHCRVGNVVDTQRRRRRQQGEVYLTRAVLAS